MCRFEGFPRNLSLVGASSTETASRPGGNGERSFRTSSRDLAFRGFRVAPISIRFLTLKNQGIPDCHLASAGLVLCGVRTKKQCRRDKLINVLDLKLTPC